RSPAAVSDIEYLGPEPDRWRSATEPSLKNEQEPEHFIDLELLDAFGPLPAKRFDFEKQLETFQRDQQAKGNPSAANLTPDKVGLQPWVVAEVWERLIVAFRQYRAAKQQGLPTAHAEATAIYYAGWLGHYVADASNPLHTTVQYNGWTGPNPNHYTTQHTIHWHFESEYVHANLKPQEITPLLHQPKPMPAGWEGEWADYLAYLKHSNSLVEPLYKLDSAGAFREAGTPDGHKFTVARLAEGAQKLSDMWYSAWLQSAVPVPDRP
ncbi:MAG TPA: nuclease, partial [Terriglobales bacterium]